MNLRFLLTSPFGHFSLALFSQTNHVIIGCYVKEEVSSEARVDDINCNYLRS